ncbi:MAG TPA: disulfide bond formation protein B [Acetobacteraceae bacterium]|nr:disulfide bond formation protein B [Acetobacteraceae bacterium]
MPPLSPRPALAASGLAAAAALGVAFAAEWWGRLVPCPLCLVERWPYRIAIALAVLGLLLPRRAARWALALVLAAGLAEVAAAGVHVGVELHAWPSPLPECNAPRFSGGSIAERLRTMPARPSKSCEEGVFPIQGLKLSFADLNLIYALAFCAGTTLLLSATSRRDA